MESIRRGHWANRPCSHIVPPRTVMGYETRTASTATERRAIETIHPRYWTLFRDLFSIASALPPPDVNDLEPQMRCQPTRVIRLREIDP
jgi:hypothetical protein